MKDETTGTDKEVAEDIAAHAVEAFKNHVLTKLGDGEWGCAQPGRGAYSFRVICRPGVIVVYGDLGDWILHMYERDPVRWLPAAVRDPNYMFEKVQAAPGCGMKCWYLQDAKAFLLERIAEDAKDAEPVEPGDEQEASDWQLVLDDLPDDDETTHQTFLEVCRDNDLDDMYSIGVGFTGRARWLHAALSWFAAAELASRAAAPALEEVARGS